MTNATTSNSIFDDVNVQRAVSIAFDDGVKTARKQFKEYLEKKKTEYEKERGTMRFGGDVIDKIINELFKKE